MNFFETVFSRIHAVITLIIDRTVKFVRAVERWAKRR